jgi:HSP20 family protein
MTVGLERIFGRRKPMQPIDQALHEVRSLHEQVTRSPAPEIAPPAFLPFPPGIDPVACALDEVSRLKRLVEQSHTTAAPAARWMPRANVYAGESGMTFVVELPGVDKDALELTVSGGELLVRGHRTPSASAGALQPLVMEQPWGAFERRFPLPTWCSPESIEARCSGGLLEIRVTRAEDGTQGEFRIEIS